MSYVKEIVPCDECDEPTQMRCDTCGKPVCGHCVVASMPEGWVCEECC